MNEPHDTPPRGPLNENRDGRAYAEKYQEIFGFPVSESGLEADGRRLNVLLGADGVVRTPARLAGWVRSLVVADLAALRRSGRVVRGLDVLEFLDALRLAEVSENGRVVGGGGSIGVGDGVGFLTSARAAELLECDARSVRRACQEGRLRGRRLGHEWLIAEGDLDEFRFGKGKRNGGERDSVGEGDAGGH